MLKQVSFVLYVLMNVMIVSIFFKLFQNAYEHSMSSLPQDIWSYRLKKLIVLPILLIIVYLLCEFSISLRNKKMLKPKLNLQSLIQDYNSGISLSQWMTCFCAAHLVFELFLLRLYLIWYNKETIRLCEVSEKTNAETELVC